MTRKPDGYPLPWNADIDLPYWQLNAALNGFVVGWRDFQKMLSMDEIIPQIDKIIESGECDALFRAILFRPKSLSPLRGNG